MSKRLDMDRILFAYIFTWTSMCSCCCCLLQPAAAAAAAAAKEKIAIPLNARLQNSDRHAEAMT
eukprot:2169586-Karenia_brevis.AAC.1